MKKFLSWLVGLFMLMAFVLTACSAAGGLDATSWELESYADAAGNMVDALPDSAVTLNFQADQVSGMASCNNYSGSYQTTGSKIEFGPQAVTQKMCTQPEIMEQESAYLSALEAAAEYDLKGDTLEIKDNQGDVILVFTRVTGN